MNPYKRLLFTIFALLSILLIGTIGFVMIEGSQEWTWLDSFYFTLITMTTIGFGETHTLSQNGKIFTIFLIFSGVGTTAYAISTSAHIILEGQLNKYFWSKRMSKAIHKLHQHYIICGYGRIGSYICEEFALMKFPFVVIESDEKRILEIEQNKLLLVEGDATNDNVLLKAGIENAKGIVIAVGNDAASVFITLSARGLNKSVYILARYEQLGTGEKLLKAGADKAVSPHLVSGGKMVQLLLKPNVTDFLELAASYDMIELTFEELKIKKESKLVNKSLAQSNLRQHYGVIVVGIHSANGEKIFNPPSETLLKEGDILIVLGDFEQINKLYTRENPSHYE